MASVFIDTKTYWLELILIYIIGMEKREFLKAIAAGGLGGLTASQLGHQNTAPSSALSKYQQRFEEILDTGRIKGGWISYTTYFSIDLATGERRGIFYEICTRIAEAAGFTIDWAPESNYATVANDLEMGKFDVFCGGLWPEAKRARLISFSDALFFSALEIYHHPRLAGTIKDIQQLNSLSYTMAAIDGEMASVVQRTDFPQSKIYSLPANTDITLAIEAVASGHADFTASERVVALEYLLQNPEKVVRIAQGKPIRVFPNTIAVARDNMPMMNLLQVGLRDLLYSGAVDKILEKYEKIPGSYLRTVSTFETAE